MTPDEIQETLSGFREEQEVVAAHLKTWLRTGSSAALERLAVARQAEDALLELILGDSYIWFATGVPQPGRKSKLNPDQIEDAKRRRDQGESTASIARGLGVSGHTVRRWF